LIYVAREIYLFDFGDEVLLKLRKKVFMEEISAFLASMAINYHKERAFLMIRNKEILLHDESILLTLSPALFNTNTNIKPHELKL